MHRKRARQVVAADKLLVAVNVIRGIQIICAREVAGVSANERKGGLHVVLAIGSSTAGCRKGATGRHIQGF